jgi:hypothetical protein
MYLGAKKYYQWIKENKKTYSEELNKSIGNLKKLRFIIIDLKMLQLTFDATFKDKRFDSLYSNIKNSIVFIGKRNWFCKKVVSVSVKLFMLINRRHKHVGFINYILIDLENNRKINGEGLSMNEIKKILEKQHFKKGKINRF